MDESKNLLIAVVISVVVLLIWRSIMGEYYPAPQEENIPKEITHHNNVTSPTIPARVSYLERPDAIKKHSRIELSNEFISGSINLTGARLDDLKLSKYNESIDSPDDKVALLSPQNSYLSYFLEIGWIQPEHNLDLPSPTTEWIADSTHLSPNNPVTLTWTNPQGVEFSINYSINEQYMFTITQSISNRSNSQIEIIPYYRINRIRKDLASNFIIHEGSSSTFNKKFTELSYEDLKKKKNYIMHNSTDNSGWFGFTDKYWFTAFIPNTHEFSTVKASYKNSNDQDIFQIDSMETTKLLNQGDTVTTKKFFFAGPKEIEIIDKYKEELNIDMFDRNIDFGVFYVLTKPILLFLKFCYSITNNFGASILILTVIIKSLMIPITNKSFVSMTKMRLLQPKINEIKEKFSKDKLAMQQESMKLFKQYNVKPMSGCLPILCQIPVFFALYKVLYVSIDMRHAPFFGWISDLSAPDPSNVFTLFGLIPWETPDFLSIGILPLLLGVTLIIQQRLGGTLSNIQDPTQENIMKLMPYFFVFIFASFPSGLIIYWILGNIISIIQQHIVRTRTISTFKEQYNL